MVSVGFSFEMDRMDYADSVYATYLFEDGVVHTYSLLHHGERGADEEKRSQAEA